MKKTLLRQILIRRGMTCVDLAKKIGNISPRTIQALAQGKRKPSIDTAKRIAKTLREKVEILFP